MRQLRISARFFGTCALAAAGAICVGTGAVHGQTKPADVLQARGGDNSGHEDNVEFFTQKVRPVLAQNCYKCHTTEAAGELRLDSLQAVLKGGETGPAMVPGDPEKSLIVQAIRQTGDLKMPPDSKLNDSDIASLTEWVKRGGQWDSAESSKPVVALLTSAQAKGAPGDDYFENKVRPILSTQCGSCHIDRAAGGLSMASRDALLKGGASGPGIVPGDPDKSLLLIAVHQSGSLKMPKGGAKLSEGDIQILADWVKMGAPWPQAAAPIRAEGKQITDDMRKWWAFQPLKYPEIPQVKDPTLKSWAKTDIDRLVLAKLEEKGMKPSAMADKRTLIRRATLDLTGLPPTPEEIDAFEKDSSPDAFAKVVDRLLASSAYGERWGRHWLDVARYGDDDIRGLDPRFRGYMPLDGAWVYRDWVIKAFNTDIPYDQFVKMQLAGDQMSKNPTPDDLKATSFLGGAPWIWDQAEPLQGRADERNERIDAVTRGFLGLTVACARCHDHKYDPILAKDYYALGGVFASSTYKEYNLVPDSEVDFWRDKFKKANELDDEAEDYTRTVTEDLSRALASQTSVYMVAAWQVSGKPKKTVAQAADAAQLDPEMLDRWVKFLDKKQSFYPYLHDWQMMIAQGGTEDQAKFLAESFQQRIVELEIEHDAIEKENDKIKAKAGVPTEREKDVKPSDFETYDQFCPGCTLELKVLPTEEANLYTDLFMRQLGTFTFVEEGGRPGLFVFHGWDLERRLGPAQQAYLAALAKGGGHGGRAMAVGQIYPFVHGMADKPKVMDIAIDLRGNPHAHGDIAPRAFPTVLGPAGKKPYTEGSGRLQLAEDIVATPLASRVWVNRVWKWHFGTGIVNSADNFGKVGDPPSDPELLDYLAVEFQKNGMSLKKLQRTIMLSAVYQQSSKETEDEHVKDPQNRYYSHFSLQRLDAEQLRDSMLFVAGDLDNKDAGGPATTLDMDNHKRTIYAKVSRFRIDPFLQAFDFPNPTFTAEQRFSTNVPVQRLYFMNNNFVYAQAGVLADRVNSKGDDAARIKETYRLLYGREPSPAELQAGLDFLKNTPEKPGYMVAQEPLTAWKQYTRVLFSSNEFEFLN